MRRAVVSLLGITLVMGLAGPVQADHCKTDASIASCPNPVNVIVIEGVGNVCSKAAGLIQDQAYYNSLYGRYMTTSCTYDLADPTWSTKPISPWTNPPQGLYWPTLGPGAVGPYALAISKTGLPPTNFCVATVGGPGCGLHAEGMLYAGKTVDQHVKRTGAHCGSSNGVGTVKFTAANNLTQVGTLSWEQSIATILPLRGQILSTRSASGATIPNPSGQTPKVVGYVSARGIGGAGNCGITEATTGFQVEGFAAIY